MADPTGQSDGSNGAHQPIPPITPFDKWRTIQILIAFVCAVASGTALNYLAALAPKTIPPVALNGWRTLVAFVIVAILAVFFIPLRDLRMRRREVVWYVVLAAMTMAVPHALIFVGLQAQKVDVAAVAFIEAAVLGVVLVYLFTGNQSVNWLSGVCALLSLVGLAIFLKVNPVAIQISKGIVLILGAAIATGVGLIAAEKLEPPTDNPSFPGKLGRSLKKTMYCCLLSGVGTLIVIGGLNLGGGVKEVVPVPPVVDWPWVLALALVGNCLTWFSMFLLIALRELLLAAVVLPAIAATTVMVDFFWFPNVVMTSLQWLGGSLIFASLLALFWFQLGSTRK